MFDQFSLIYAANQQQLNLLPKPYDRISPTGGKNRESVIIRTEHIYVYILMKLPSSVSTPVSTLGLQSTTNSSTSSPNGGETKAEAREFVPGITDLTILAPYTTNLMTELGPDVKRTSPHRPVLAQCGPLMLIHPFPTSYLAEGSDNNAGGVGTELPGGTGIWKKKIRSTRDAAVVKLKKSVLKAYLIILAESRHSVAHARSVGISESGVTIVTESSACGQVIKDGNSQDEK